MSFIKIGNRTLDSIEYNADISEMVSELEHELDSCLAKYGFQKAKADRQGYGKAAFMFLNYEMGLEAKIRIITKH